MGNTQERNAVLILCAVFFCAVLFMIPAAAAATSASLTITGVYKGIPPVAAFTYLPVSPIANQPVTFTDTSTGGPLTSWAWDFNNDGIVDSTAQGPVTYTYTTAGTYYANLTVINAAGKSTKIISFTVAAPPVPLKANFTATQICKTPWTVTFTDTSSGGPTSRIWQYSTGGGSWTTFGSGALNPTFPLSKSGTTYNIWLTVKRGTESSSIIKPVTQGTLTASFNYAPNKPSAGQLVTFTDTSKGVPTSWTWDVKYGSGSYSTFSTSQNPSYTFLTSGTYTVRLTPKNACITCTPITKAIPICVAAPKAAFSGSVLSGSTKLMQTLTDTPGDTPLSGTAPLWVAFTDLSENSPTSWKWQYRNATTGWTQFATTQDPLYSFPPGTYSINLTASNDGGSGSAITENYIIVTAPPAPVAGFSATPLSGTAPLSVTFTDLSTNNPVSWKWGRRNLTSAAWTLFNTTKNPIQSFAAGNWSVNLTAINAGGSSISSQETWVNVSAPTYTAVSFTTVGSTTWIVPAGVTSVEYLVIAGGGGGGGSANVDGGRSGGGGGAGGFRTGTLAVTPGASLTVTVGAGGAGGAAGANSGTKGGNSVFSSITSTGGGYGGAKVAGGAGGSGGGGSNTKAGGTALTSPVQGYNGGTSGNLNTAGGGGGAAALGGASTSNTCGAGGAGKTSSITGEMYAGGGGGGFGTAQGVSCVGGSGGGGAGAAKAGNGVDATRYGSGGGGAASLTANQNGGKGSSGIVIIKYQNP